jgi:hypothetical protein
VNLSFQRGGPEWCEAPIDNHLNLPLSLNIQRSNTVIMCECEALL